MTHVIFSQDHRHRGQGYAVWSYLEGKASGESTLRFAFRVNGDTISGLETREVALREAKARIERSLPQEEGGAPGAPPPARNPGEGDRGAI